jgi:hypothetical protein
VTLGGPESSTRRRSLRVIRPTLLAPSMDRWRRTLLSHNLGSEGGAGTIVGVNVGKYGMRLGEAASWQGMAAVTFGPCSLRHGGPRRASANATYLGGEIGFGGLVGRFSIGYAKRISGRSTEDGHIVTWGLGIEIASFFS